MSEHAMVCAVLSLVVRRGGLIILVNTRVVSNLSDVLTVFSCCIYPIMNIKGFPILSRPEQARDSFPNCVVNH